MARNNPTLPARQVWSALFPSDPWPRGLRVEWAGFMRGALGMTIYRERRILLSLGDFRGPAMIHHRDGTVSARPGPVDTLLHEFTHWRYGRTLRHGPEFLIALNRYRARLGMEPSATWR